MVARIGKLEALGDKIAERLGALERAVAVIKSNYATRSAIAANRADIADAKNSIVMSSAPSCLRKFCRSC